MASINDREHTSIAYFNPDVEVYNKAHQDLLLKFNAGDGYDNFNGFVSEEAIEYANNGDGVTYLVWNIFCGEDGSETRRELVAYYMCVCLCCFLYSCCPMWACVEEKG